MSKIPSPPFQIWGADLNASEVLFPVASEEIILFLLFSIFLKIHFGIVHIWSTYHGFDQRISLLFFLSKRAAFCSKYEFWFVKLSYILFQFLLSWVELWKCTPIILMENFGQTICFGLSILFLYAKPCKVWHFEILFLS